MRGGLEAGGADVAVVEVHEWGEAVRGEFGEEVGVALRVEFEAVDLAVLLGSPTWFCGFVARGIAVEDCARGGVRE